MTTHRFACGEDVILKAGHGSRIQPGAVFTITRLLPFEGATPRYLLKNDEETFSRAVAEDAIRVPPISGPSSTAQRVGNDGRPGVSALRGAAEALFARRAVG
jgi:hypothetical protein